MAKRGVTRRAAALLGQAFDLLSVRLAATVAVLVILPIAVGLYALSHHRFDQAMEAKRRAAESQNRILGTALRHQMMDRDPTLLAAVLDEIGSQPEVQRAMILDHEGRIAISSEPEEVGKVLSQTSATCLVCHSKEKEERESWVLLESDTGDVLRSVLPLENRPECYRCHDAEEEFNGILMLDVSLAELQNEMRADVVGIIVGAGALALFLLASIGFVVRRLVLDRLARLSRTARSIAAGNWKERTQERGRDVIGSLARDFNGMAESVENLVAEVKERASQLVSVMNSLDDGLVVLDLNCRVLAGNHSFCQRVGIHPETLQGRRCHGSEGNLLACCTQERECPALRCMATGRVQRAVFRDSNGAGQSNRIEEVHASPVLDQNGEVTHVVEVWRDISQRMQEQQKLAEIEHLVSLGALASGFCHEVNTPLASMLTSAESILGRTNASLRFAVLEEELPAIRQSARTIQEQVLRCRKITDQFRRFSRCIPPSVEPLDLRQKVEEIIALVSPTAREASVTLELEDSGPIPPVMANTEVIQHVLLNLLINAIQSCGAKGGRVTVSLWVAADVRIDIQDSGCGIAVDEQRHLFEPFRSHKPHGTGLGLFLSRSFMRRFGGDVRLVESRVSVGSCFQVMFVRAGKESPS